MSSACGSAYLGWEGRGRDRADQFTYYIKLFVVHEPLFRVATGRYAPTFLNFSTHKTSRTSFFRLLPKVGCTYVQFL